MLYDCETWSLTLREERRLRVFEDRILRRIFVPKRYENGEWRRLHNEEPHSSPNIVVVIKSRGLRWAGHIARMGEDRSTFNIFTSKPTGKRRLGRPMRRREDNIRMDLKEIGINTRNLDDLTQDMDYWRALANVATSEFHKPWN